MLKDTQTSLEEAELHVKAHSCSVTCIAETANSTPSGPFSVSVSFSVTGLSNSVPCHNFDENIAAKMSRNLANDLNMLRLSNYAGWNLVGTRTLLCRS